MWLSYGLSGGVIQTWAILRVVRAGYPGGGYPVGCQGGLSGWGLSGQFIRAWVIREPEGFSVGGPPATSFRSRLSEEVTLSGA